MSTDNSGAPIRHTINWRDEAFYDVDDLDAERRRVFDISHGCRRCFNLCDLCFMTKCPYVPPHEFDLDFPHLMRRYRAAEKR